MSASMEQTRDFASSELGTKEFWDKAYDREIQSYEEFGDVGEIWFGEDIGERIMRWMDDHVSTSDSVIDLGCGNGMMLIELYRRGYTDLTGVDYSEGAIKLAKSIAEKEGINSIKYQVGNLISEDSRETNLTHQYQICIDKGTYDAISLIPDDEQTARGAYVRAVKQLITADGFFIITSCNWTKDQLLKYFENDFSLVSEIKTPSFQFGGRKGNTVTSLIFKPEPS